MSKNDFIEAWRYTAVGELSIVICNGRFAPAPCPVTCRPRSPRHRLFLLIHSGSFQPCPLTRCNAVDLAKQEHQQQQPRVINTPHDHPHPKHPRQNLQVSFPAIGCVLTRSPKEKVQAGKITEPVRTLRPLSYAPDRPAFLEPWEIFRILQPLPARLNKNSQQRPRH